jgi:hypothetical protein
MNTTVAYPKSPLEGLGARLLTAVPMIGFSVVFAARFGTEGLIVAIAELLVGTVVLLIWQTSASKRVCLVVEPGGAVRFRGALRDRQLFVGAAPGKAVRCPWNRGSGAPVEIWVLLNQKGDAELGLSARGWNSADLTKICERLEIGEERSSVTRSTKELIAAYPGVLPKWTVHIKAISIIGTLVVIGVIAIATTI